MKMWKILTIVFLATGLLACQQSSSNPSAQGAPLTASMTGGVDGGGGKGVLCGSSLMTLDLFEARLHGLHPQARETQLNENLKFFGMELAQHLAESLDGLQDPQIPELILKEMNQAVVARFRDLPPGQRLPLTNDATVPPLPDNCSIVQIAVYSQDGVIHRDAQYWNQLSLVEQTALILHEWIYHRARQYGALNSDESRKVIGMIFSGKNPEPLLSPFWAAGKKFWCGAGKQNSAQKLYEIFGVEEVRNGTPGIALYFRAFQSVYLASRTSAFLPGLTRDQFLSLNFQPMTVKVRNELMNTEWNFEIGPDAGFSSGYSLRAFANGEMSPEYSQGFCRAE